jgi:hypothetical protein
MSRAPRRLRAYALTQGRTHADSSLTLDAMLAANQPVHRDGFTPEQVQILDLCTSSPQSLADLSAALDLPLQVIRVLLVDLITGGAVGVSDGDRAMAAHHDLALLEEVLDGIESL